MKDQEQPLVNRGGLYELAVEYCALISTSNRLAVQTKRNIKSHMAKYIALLDGKIPTNTWFNGVIANLVESGMKGGTVRNFIIAIKRFHKWAGSRAPDPTRPINITVPESDYKRETFSKEEYEKIKAGVDAGWIGPCIVAYNTGLRLSDVCMLHWDDIDMKGMWIKAVPIKTRRYKTGVRLPITPGGELATFLSEWGKLCGTSGYLFPHLAQRCRAKLDGKEGQGAMLPAEFVRQIKRIGIRGKTFHTFRRTFITNVMSSGVDSIIAREFTGIKDVKTLLHYAVIGDDALRNAINRTNAYIEAKT